MAGDWLYQKKKKPSASLKEIMINPKCLNHLNPDNTQIQVNLMARLEAQRTFYNPEEKQRRTSRSIEPK